MTADIKQTHPALFNRPQEIIHNQQQCENNNKVNPILKMLNKTLNVINCPAYTKLHT